MAKRVLDPDRGSADALDYKKGGMLGEEEAGARSAELAGARDLDERIEAMPGLTRQQRDRDRAMPRATVGELGHPRKRRTLPQDASTLKPLSSRQRKARSKTKRQVQRSVPKTQRQAVLRAITDHQHWTKVNDQLYDAAGDVQLLPDAERQDIQRIDRAIQAYERANDRGHVVFVNAEPPDAVNWSNVDGFVNNQIPEGSNVYFARFSAGAHNLHEIEPAPGEEWMPVFAVQTRRGLYLGGSDGVDDTRHLLPRALLLRRRDYYEVTYQRADGTFGTRRVIELVDEES